MKKFRHTEEIMKYLPEEVVREILLRLPVKSLLRFRSVCKLWRSLISDLLFAKSHFELASNAADKLVYLTPSQTLSMDVDASFHDDSVVATLNFPITAPFDSIHILGSCRGFVLLDDWNNLFVWNPSTGFCKKLPYYPICLQHSFFKYGFGYDSSKDDYCLVVIASYGTRADDFETETRIDFLSLRSNSWQKVEGTHIPHLSPNYQDGGVFLNGILHWLSYLIDEEREGVIAFDLLQKNVRELPLPDDYELDLEFYSCRVLGGCFSIYTVSKFMTEIWIMKEYGVKSSWSKSVMVSTEETPVNRFFSPICFTKGGEIVGIYNHGGLMKRKLEGELLEIRRYGHAMYGCRAVMYTECLLPLPCDIEGGGGEDRQD